MSALSKLTEMQQKFVEVYTTTNCNRAEAARQAGYSGKGEAFRLWNNPRVQDAIVEESRKKLTGLAGDAVATLETVMRNPKARDADRVNAAKTILDRAGIVARTTVDVTHDITAGGGMEAMSEEALTALLERTETALQELGTPVLEIEADRVD